MRRNLTTFVNIVTVGVIFVLCIHVIIFLKSSGSKDDTLTGDLLGSGAEHMIGSSPDTSTEFKATPPLKSTVTCPGLQMKEPLQDGEFQVIRGHMTYVYSAYLDQNSVRIIALQRVMRPGGTLTCHLWFSLKDGDPLFVTDARAEFLPEDHERRFTAAYIFCQIPRKLRAMVPLAVSVVTGDPCAEASNSLHVHEPGVKTSQFTVCVTPLNFRYSRAYELVEMIEMNRILGADKFVFYNHTTGPNVDQVLEMYSKEGVVEVHPWPLPMKTDTWPPSGDQDIHYFAQIAALNDCLYRHRNSTEYIVYEDLDEFIIPQKHDTWAELVRDREELVGAVSAFQFMCVFFRKEWPSPAEEFGEAAKKFKSNILAYTLRESKFYLHGYRSKFIVNPRLVSTVGVHQVWEHSHTVDTVPEDVASLHHYRTWEKPNDPISRVKDTLAIQKYGSQLVENLEKAWSKLEGVSMNIDITVYGDNV